MLLDVAIASKDYLAADGRPRRALEDLRLTLKRGEAGAVVGPSGCGKTTLLRIVAGLDRDFVGSVKLPAHGRLGMVFQEPRLLPWRNVADNIHIAAPRASGAEIEALLDTLGLAGHAEHFPRQLSLGLARRAALARALAIKPDLLLLDEPLVSLDAALALELRDLLARLIDENSCDDLDRHARPRRGDRARRQDLHFIAAPGAGRRRARHSDAAPVDDARGGRGIDAKGEDGHRRATRIGGGACSPGDRLAAIIEEAPSVFEPEPVDGGDDSGDAFGRGERRVGAAHVRAHPAGM